MIYRLRLTTRDGWNCNRSAFPAGDAHDECVVRSGSVAGARIVAAGHAGEEGESAWMHESTTVDMIENDGPDEWIG